MATAAQLRTACVTAANNYLNALAQNYLFADITEAVSFALSHDVRFARLGNMAVLVRDQAYQIVRATLQTTDPATVADATAFANNLATTFPPYPTKATLESGAQS